jgi:Domain of unknown function (DUF4158)
MREIRPSGSMSGVWKRSMARLVRHRRPKGPDTDRPSLNHRATPRLYTDDASRLGFALQLGTLRHLGFCPDDLASAPPEVVGFLADQLRVDPQALSAYGQRAQTRTDHFLAVQAYVGFRKPDPEERKRLAR